MKQDLRLPNAVPSDPQLRLRPLFLLQPLPSHREAGLKTHRPQGSHVGTEAKEEAGSEAAPTIAIAMEESLLLVPGTPGAGEQESPRHRLVGGAWEGSDFLWTAVPSIRQAENGPWSN